MKKVTLIFIAIVLVFTFSSAVCADNFQVIGREISPGFDLGGITVGALFIGKFFDQYWNERGRFTLSLAHNGEFIEECGKDTILLGFKLIMNFNTGARLVLVGPDSPIAASWDLDDPECTEGDCPLTDYADYWTLVYEDGLPDCDDDNYKSDSYIAEVPVFDVYRRRFGSYGVPSYSHGVVSGYLIHTPIVSPAIFGIIEFD